MFKTFGELNQAAAEALAANDMEKIRTIAKENGMDPDDAEDYIAGDIGELATPLTAALGRLKVESEDLHLTGVLIDWVDEIKQACMEDETICAGVMAHELAGYMGAMVDKGWEQRVTVDKRIVQQAEAVKEVMGNHKLSIGIPNMAERKKTIKAYYGGAK